MESKSFSKTLKRIDPLL